MKTSSCRINKKVSFSPTKLYIWDDESQSVREYANARGFCFANSWIRYGIGEEDGEGNRIVYVGQFGKEAAVKVSPQPPKEHRVSNSFSCKSKPLSEFSPPLPKDREYRVLREGDGFLSLEPHDKKVAFWQHPRNITLFREKGASPVTLPITWDEGIGHTTVEYSEYLKAYLIRPWKFLSTKYPSSMPGEKGPGPWPMDEPQVIYKLIADTGAVERLVTPNIYVDRRLIGIGSGQQPTRIGWVYSAGRVGSLGLYMLVKGEPQRVEAGAVGKMLASPDGCKVAIVVNNWYYLQEVTPTTVKVVNFCGEGK